MVAVERPYPAAEVVLSFIVHDKIWDV